MRSYVFLGMAMQCFSNSFCMSLDLCPVNNGQQIILGFIMLGMTAYYVLKERVRA